MQKAEAQIAAMGGNPWPSGFRRNRDEIAAMIRYAVADGLAAQEIAPEVLRMAGVFAIMLTQSTRLSLAAFALLPFYLLLAVRSARRLETGMAGYYEMWEEVSARIQDALATVKTVKLSGAEAREVERLRVASARAYDDYLARNRLSNRYLLGQVVLQ